MVDDKLAQQVAERKAQKANRKKPGRKPKTKKPDTVPPEVQETPTEAVPVAQEVQNEDVAEETTVVADLTTQEASETLSEAPTSDFEGDTLATLPEEDKSSQNAPQEEIELSGEMVDVLVRDIRISKVFEQYAKVVHSGGRIKEGTAPRMIGGKSIRCVVPKEKEQTWKDVDVLPVKGKTYTSYYVRHPRITNLVNMVTAELKKGAILNPKRPSRDNGMYTVFLLSEKAVDSKPGLYILETKEWEA